MWAGSGRGGDRRGSKRRFKRRRHPEHVVVSDVSSANRPNLLVFEIRIEIHDDGDQTLAGGWNRHLLRAKCQQNVLATQRTTLSELLRTLGNKISGAATGRGAKLQIVAESGSTSGVGVLEGYRRIESLDAGGSVAFSSQTHGYCGKVGDASESGRWAWMVTLRTLPFPQSEENLFAVLGEESLIGLRVRVCWPNSVSTTNLRSDGIAIVFSSPETEGDRRVAG